ncbi:outer membrane protein [Aestuariivirga sp. YIM B02566]|uniref:Porin family protein n=1 Tax=Taklimakanibacter albus TaxID=2800327 RepID=A0ACC5REZ6_9HYPH|nr:outer membrane beta-barrel protein [Aestuariivirga sp. YIM B02566]MBK1871271.1 porin family protein [Aestuariivirga sp. YIM B02566]
MKKLIKLSATPAIIAGMTALSSTASLAADADVQSSFDDVNFYIGATGGYLTGTAKHEVEYSGGGSDSDTTKADLGILSAIVGVDVRSNGWLFGIEGDIGIPLGDFPDDNDVSEEMQWSDMKYNAHLRARVGRSVDNIDLFIAGGLAIAKFESIDWDDENRNTTLTGFTIGGGVDWAFNDLLKARVEVLYDDYGDEDTFGDNTQYSGDWSDVTVRGGLLFTF